MIKISILLLTHNRPFLFSRCLEAILPQLTNEVEVIVNNDSNDIVEVNHPSIRYFYNSYDNLSLVYKFLLESANGQYVYYAEDDDYLTTNIVKHWLIWINNYDLLVGNFYPTYRNVVEDKTFWSKVRMFSEDGLYFLDKELLQLSQYVFKKELITNFDFPMNSDIHNDILIVEYALSNTTKIKTTNKIFYYQTTDGGDNLSF